MRHDFTSLARDVTVETWRQEGVRRHVMCISRHGPIIRMALVGAHRMTPPAAIWDAAQVIHDHARIDAALQVANLRAGSYADGDTVPAISTLVIEIGPTHVQLVRVGVGEAWLRSGTRAHWTPALPPVAPHAWASPPLGYTSPMQYEACRIPRHRPLRAVVALSGSELGDLRLNNLGMWLQTTAAPADDESGEGRVIVSARIGARC